jgi:thymidylate kinase
MEKIIRVDIIDTDWDNENPRIMETFYLVNPDVKKLDRLQKLMKNRFDYEEDNEENIEYFEEIYDYIEENFTSIDIELKEIEW